MFEPSTLISTGILTVIGILLWVRLGYSAGNRRAQAWAAIAVLHVLWAGHLAMLGRETAFTAGINAVVFVAIAVHRSRVDNPDGAVGRWFDRHPKVPRGADRGEDRT